MKRKEKEMNGQRVHGGAGCGGYVDVGPLAAEGDGGGSDEPVGRWTLEGVREGGRAATPPGTVDVVRQVALKLKNATELSSCEW